MAGAVSSLSLFKPSQLVLATRSVLFQTVKNGIREYGKSPPPDTVLAALVPIAATFSWVGVMASAMRKTSLDPDDLFKN